MPTPPGPHSVTRRCCAEECHHGRGVRVAADEAREPLRQWRRRWCDTGGRLRLRVGEQLVRLLQDETLQSPELGAGLEAELVEAAGQLAVGLEGVGLPALAVEREHQHGHRTFAQRLVDHRSLERGQRLGAATEVEQRLQPPIGRPQAHLLEAAELRLRPVGVAEVGVGLGAEQPERLLVALERGGRRQPVRLRDESLGADRVDLLGLDREPVPATVAHDPVPADRAPQAGDADVQRCAGPAARLGSPQRLDELVRGDRAAEVRDEVREQGALEPAIDGDRSVGPDDLERAEHAQLHVADRSEPAGEAGPVRCATGRR